MQNMLNGWNVSEMTSAIDEVREQPEAGALVWRSRVTWDGAFGLDVRTREIEQLGEVMERRFTMRGDHPQELLGDNTGPTAIELILGALGACVAGTYAAQATARGVALDALDVDVEGSIDLNGFFGLQEIPAGISDVAVSVRVRSEADASVLEEIGEATTAHSPVYDSITRPIPVRTKVEKL